MGMSKIVLQVQTPSKGTRRPCHSEWAIHIPRGTPAYLELPTEFLERQYFPLLTRYIPYQSKTLHEKYYILQKFDLTLKKISHSSLPCKQNKEETSYDCHNKSRE